MKEFSSTTILVYNESLQGKSNHPQHRQKTTIKSIFGVQILLNCFYKTSFSKTKGGLWRYILSFCTYCRRRQYVPTLTAHIVVHRHILSPATICAETTLLSLLHNGRRNVQSCIGTYCRRRHYVPWPCAHFVADILSWQIISWQKIDVKRERKIDTHTHTHAPTHARAHTHRQTDRLTDR